VKLLCGVSEKNAPHYLKNLLFFKGLPELQNPENVPTLIVLDELCLFYKSEPNINQNIASS